MTATKNERSRAWYAASLCGILALLCLSTHVPAQESYEFIYKARNADLVSARGVTVGPDGRIYMANAHGGVRVYCCDGVSMTCAASIFDAGSPQRIAVARDGMVYVAAGSDGLRAYRCGDSVLSCAAHVRDGNWAMDVALGHDGLVYVAWWNEGLHAYRCTERGLVDAGHVDDVTGGGHARGVAVAPDGTVILSVDGDGLYAYRHEGDAFVRTAHTAIGEDLYSVAVGESGLVFHANGRNGLQVYRIENGAFVHVAMADDNVEVFDIALASDGTVYAAGDDGLRAYSFAHRTLELIGRAGEGMTARGVSVHRDNSVFLACGDEGLFRYTRLGSEYVCLSRVTDNIPYPGEAIASCQGPDGTVFLANGNDGIYAYDYTGSAFHERVHRNDCGVAKNIAVGPDNLVYVGNDRHELLIYSYTGTELVLRATLDLGTAREENVTDIAAPVAGLAYVSMGGGGLLRIVRENGMFVNAAAVYPADFASGVAVGADGTVFLAGGTKGLFAYRIEEDDFMPVAHAAPGEGGFHAVTVGRDGMLFALQGVSWICAFRFTGDDLIPTGSIYEERVEWSYGFGEVGAGPDQSVFASSQFGIFAYQYADGVFSPQDVLALPGNGIDLGRDGTLFLSNVGEGLFAYRYMTKYTRLPQISVTPAAIDFGDLLVDQARPRAVTIRNSGTAPLEFYVQKVVGANAQDFRFSATLPDDIPMNSEIALGIVCYPLSGGAKGAVLQLGTNDPVNPLIEIPLSAYAVVTPVRDELRPEPAIAPGLDVLSAATATLSPNYPNPFNPLTTVAFAIPRDGHVRVEVLDLVGRRVAVLADQALHAGLHRVRFDGADLPSGIYVCRLQYDGTMQTRRMVMMK